MPAAALIARGFAEMTRFGLDCGARRETSGRPVGAGRPRPHRSSVSSRNFSLARASARGAQPPNSWPIAATVAEGVVPCSSTGPAGRRTRRGSDCRCGRRPAWRRIFVDAVLEHLLARPPRAEVTRNRSRYPSYQSPYRVGSSRCSSPSGGSGASTGAASAPRRLAEIIGRIEGAWDVSSPQMVAGSVNAKV